MKRVCIGFCLWMLVSESKAQEFSFPLYFSDHAGNKDTLILGYDPTASNGIDQGLGEINIIGQKIEKSLDVRVTDEWRNREYNGIPGSFHSKVQFVNYRCPDWRNTIQSIDIFTKNWPVSMSWDTSLYQEVCRKGTILTCIHPGGWWDTGCPSDLGVQRFSEDGVKSFHTNNYKKSIQYGYVNADQDTIAYYFFAFATTSILQVNTENILGNNFEVKVNPNPVVDQLSLDYPDAYGRPVSLLIYSMDGRPLVNATSAAELNVNLIPSGIYMLNTLNEYGIRSVTKFLKQ